MKRGNPDHAGDPGGAGRTLAHAASPLHAEPTYTVVLAGGTAQSMIHIWLTPDGRSYVIDSVAPLEVGGDDLRKPARQQQRADLPGAAGRRLRGQRRQ